jgi:hypothetical protein
MSKGVWLDQPQACTAASTPHHLPSTVCAQGIACMLADELDQDEIRLRERTYPVVVLGQVLVVAGDHRTASAANGASKDNAFDYHGWESSLRTGAVGVDSIDDVEVWPFALATRMVFLEVAARNARLSSNPEAPRLRGSIGSGATTPSAPSPTTSRERTPPPTPRSADPLLDGSAAALAIAAKRKR